MSGMLSRDILKELCRADFEKITTYIFDMCTLIVEDYEKKQLKLPNDENKIRSIMLEEYINKQKVPHNMLGYKFELEVPENYAGNGKYIGRVDIRSLLKSDFEKDDAYYIVECKRIDGSADLNKKYVKEGVARFVTGKYSSYYGRNIMQCNYNCLCIFLLRYGCKFFQVIWYVFYTNKYRFDDLHYNVDS